MTLRRYAPLKPSVGTTWPPDVRRAVLTRDDFHCVAERAGLPVTQSCWGNAGLELDHIRAGGTGMKSPSVLSNGATLCPPCHKWKTENGRVARPLLLAYVEKAGGCSHVDERRHECPDCAARA